jgi:acetoin utilization deacetylase AcuC-like enzyme
VIPRRSKLFYCDQYEFPLPPGHKFPIRKYRLLREDLAGSGLFDLEPSPLASPQLISTVHDPAYVDAFLTGALPDAVMRRIGFPWSQELVFRTLGSVGGTVAATQQALAHGWGGGLAGGTHHAFRDEGSGFCVFNDIAIGIASLRQKTSLRRFAVVDLDVHQGDGTAKIFENDPNVMTVSLHGRSNFPFRKQFSKVDIALADGTVDADYLCEVKRALTLVWEFNPEFVFYQSGVDALASDTLGRLSLTHAGLRQRDALVLQGCKQRLIPVCITLGGGYSEPIELTVQAHASTFRLAADLFR